MVVVLPAPVGPTTAMMPPFTVLSRSTTGRCLTKSARGISDGFSRLVRRGVWAASAMATSGAISKTDNSSSTRVFSGSRNRLSFQPMVAKPLSSKSRNSFNSRCIAEKSPPAESLRGTARAAAGGAAGVQTADRVAAAAGAGAGVCGRDAGSVAAGGGSGASAGCVAAAGAFAEGFAGARSRVASTNNASS